MSDRDWIAAEMVAAFLAEHEPPHRVQRRPLPEAAPVLAEARQRRLIWLEAMRKVSHGSLTEQDRIESQDAVQSGIDNLDEEI